MVIKITTIVQRNVSIILKHMSVINTTLWMHSWESQQRFWFKKIINLRLCVQLIQSTDHCLIPYYALFLLYYPSVILRCNGVSQITRDVYMHPLITSKWETNRQMDCGCCRGLFISAGNKHCPEFAGTCFDARQLPISSWSRQQLHFAWALTRRINAHIPWFLYFRILWGHMQHAVKYDSEK